MIWSFALTDDGSLDIMDGELPSAENVVALEVADRSVGLWVVDATALAPLPQQLRRLLGSPAWADKNLSP
jgi:hypothetical protein